MNRFTIFLNWVDNDIFNIRSKSQVTALAIRRKGTQKTVLTRDHYLSMLDLTFRTKFLENKDYPFGH